MSHMKNDNARRKSVPGSRPPRRAHSVRGSLQVAAIERAADSSAATLTLSTAFKTNRPAGRPLAAEIRFWNEAFGWGR
jgi:hypothetical protein